MVNYNCFILKQLTQAFYKSLSFKEIIGKGARSLSSLASFSRFYLVLEVMGSNPAIEKDKVEGEVLVITSWVIMLKKEQSNGIQKMIFGAIYKVAFKKIIISSYSLTRQ